MKNASYTVRVMLTALLLWTVNAAAQTRPNIILILADDQGWGDLSINGNTNVRTPHIDKIGKEGARFARFYVSPLCAPTRAGLLTGRYHYRTGVWGVSNSREFMNLDETTLADRFKNAGYATGCFGKWHNGSQYPYHPNGRGFEEFYGMLSGHYANYFNTVVDHNGKPAKSTGYIADDLTTRAIDFIEKNQKAGKPFLCYIPFNTPHSPFQVPDENYDRVKKRGIRLRSRNQNENDETTVTALAMCENIDDNVGRVLQKLDELKIADNTIVIYLSDNGPNSWRWNGDMKGRKSTAGEGSVRVPFLIRWPGVIPAGKLVKGNAAYIDLLPTLIDLTDIPMPKTGKPLDGISLKPVLTTATQEVPERLLFLSINKNNSVRKGQFLYQDNALYNLTTDSTQEHDIAARFPALIDSLRNAFDLWYKDVYKNIDPARPLPVGYAEFPRTVLPSQDAILHPSPNGKLSYSASAPNSSWITNWTDTVSYVSWNVDVHKSGKYRVTLHYTSPEAGDTFVIAIDKSRISGVIPEAFDPPLIHSPDRVKRTAESYEKEFHAFDVGEFRLQKGKGELKLSARKLTGSRFADVRAIELVLIE